jgi:hypothetical protein
MTLISLHKNILEVIKDLIFYQNQLNYYIYVFNKDIYYIGLYVVKRVRRFQREN